MESLLTVWKNAPLVALLLYLLATFALAIFLERLSNVKKSKVLPKNWKTLRRLVESGALEDALRALRNDKRETSKMLLGLLESYMKKELSKGELIQALNLQGEVLYAKLSRGLTFLSVAVTLATLLGLIGTVLGLIDIFAAFGGEGEKSPQLLAKGISTALNSTAAGLIVAIVDYILYWIVKERVNSVYSKVLAELSEVLEKLP